MIFIMSHQPAEDSSALSLDILDHILGIFRGWMPRVDIDTMNHYLRKATHFFIYMVLGFWVYIALLKSGRSRIGRKTVVICAVYAISDELHQLLIPGRSGQVSDVLLDISGVMIGLAAITVIARIRMLLLPDTR